MVNTNIFIHQFELGPMQNFVYFICDKSTKTCAVVDPGWDYKAILAEAKKLRLTISHILCTHSHYDHVNEVEFLLQHLDIPVFMLKLEVNHGNFKCENLVRAHPGDIVKVGQNCEIKLIHTPGHTPGSTCFYVNDRLVTGDTMFVNGCGRCDLVGGDPAAMHKSLWGLYDKLPKNTIMYPGHNYDELATSTLQSQLQTNPWLQHHTLEDFITHRMAGKTPNTVVSTPQWPPQGRK